MLAAGPSCRTAAPPPSLSPPYLLDPRIGLPGPFGESLGLGWGKLQAGDAAGALKLFSSSGETAAGRVGRIECELVSGRLAAAREECASALEAGLDTAPLLAACGEVEAQEGDWAEAFNLFEGAAMRLPENTDLVRLRDEAAPRAAESWLEKAAEARDAGETADARQAAERALAITPGRAEALRLAGELALAEEDYEAAFPRLFAAWKSSPEDLRVGEEAGETALRTERYETASRIFGALAGADARYRGRAKEADEEYLISNWPSEDRSAAHAARLTRAQAALLLWRLVPRVRYAPAAAPAPVASDIVARKDRRILSRCLQLGLLSVEEATHRARPDAALRRPEALRILRRVASLNGAGKPDPEALPAGRGGGVSGASFRTALRALAPEEEGQ